MKYTIIPHMTLNEQERSINSKIKKDIKRIDLQLYDMAILAP